MLVESKMLFAIWWLGAATTCVDRFLVSFIQTSESNSVISQITTLRRIVGLLALCDRKGLNATGNDSVFIAVWTTLYCVRSSILKHL